MAKESNDKEKSNKEQSNKEESKKLGATELMKQIAMAVHDDAKMKKIFTPSEIAEIKTRLEQKERQLRDGTGDVYTRKVEYYTNKRYVKLLEADNRSKLFFYPSATKKDGIEWYKAMEFSALYYAYELAPKFRRQASIKLDDDRKARVQYSVSIRDIERLCEQFVAHDLGTAAISEIGVYVLTLKKPVSEEEFGRLWHMESRRQDMMRTVVKPKEMSPTVYVETMTFARKTASRLNKTEGRFYQAEGAIIQQSIHQMLKSYHALSDGRMTRTELGKILSDCLDDIMAGMALFGELRVWSMEAVTMLSEDLAILRGHINNEFRDKEELEMHKAQARGNTDDGAGGDADGSTKDDEKGNGKK